MKELLNKFMLSLIVMAFPAITIAQQSFILTGTFQNLKTSPSAVYMKSMEDTSSYKVPVVGGVYVIKGKLNGPTKFNILPVYSTKTTRPSDANSILFIYLEKGKNYVAHYNKFSNLKVKGSLAQAADDTLQSMLKKARASGAPQNRIGNVYSRYLTDHPSSPVAVYAIMEYTAKNVGEQRSAVDYAALPFSIKAAYLLFINSLDVDKALPLYEKLPGALKRSTAGKTLANEIEWGKLDKCSLPYRYKLDSVANLYITAGKRNDTAAQSKYELEMNQVRDVMYDKVYTYYIKANASSPIALNLLLLMGGSNFDDPVKSKTSFDLLSDSIKNTTAGIAYNKRLLNALRTANGQPAPDFGQPDTTGKTIRLSSYRGKYVLLDFWASWCHPCREENPNMVKLYNAYKAKGFTILSVSLDTDKKNWLTAIKQDGLSWVQVSDLKIKNEAIKLYDILGIPANILIGPDGKILAKNLFGDVLAINWQRLSDKPILKLKKS